MWCWPTSAWVELATTHGSGFLAVLSPASWSGTPAPPTKGDVERFHAALASLAEIVAFIALGLTVGLHTLPDASAWAIGLTLAVLLTIVVRPLLVGLLLRVRLGRGQGAGCVQIARARRMVAR
jgi:potassium/hydrogen antiporter